jgi:ABC-type amino acid transport substrate-binding protein
MKKIICIALAIVLLGCGNGGEKTFAKLADFKRAKIASERGTIFVKVIDDVIPNVKHQLYDSQAEVIEAVSEGKADAACLDMPIARYVAAQNHNLIVFPFPVKEDRYGFAVAKGSELGVKAGEALQAMIGRGTVKRLREAWLSADGGKMELPNFSGRADFDGSAGTIRYGYALTAAPVSQMGYSDKPAGLELDIVSRIAHGLNMNVEFIPMLFNELLPTLAAGEIDMAGGNVSITEERLKTFDFVGPYMEGGVVLVIKRSRAETQKEEL